MYFILYLNSIYQSASSYGWDISTPPSTRSYTLSSALSSGDHTNYLSNNTSSIETSFILYNAYKAVIVISSGKHLKSFYAAEGITTTDHDTCNKLNQVQNEFITWFKRNSSRLDSIPSRTNPSSYNTPNPDRDMNLASFTWRMNSQIMLCKMLITFAAIFWEIKRYFSLCLLWSFCLNRDSYFVCFDCFDLMEDLFPLVVLTLNRDS